MHKPHTHLILFCCVIAVLVKKQNKKKTSATKFGETYLLQQKSLLVPFGQLIGREGTVHAGPDHYAVVLSFGRHLDYFEQSRGTRLCLYISGTDTPLLEPEGDWIRHGSGSSLSIDC